MAKLTEIKPELGYAIKDRFSEVEDNLKEYYKEENAKFNDDINHKLEKFNREHKHNMSQFKGEMYISIDVINRIIKSVQKDRLQDKMDYYSDRIRMCAFIFIILASITVYTWITTFNIPVLIIHALLMISIIYDISINWNEYTTYKSILDEIKEKNNVGEN